MLFNLEADHGEIIEGYLVPDGFSEQPGIRVFDGDVELVSMDCDQLREAVVGSGRHATGMIGFRLTEASLPALSQRSRLSIVDRKTGMLIYRRPSQDGIVHKKVCRLETRLAPFRSFDQAVRNRFQYWVDSVERFGQETALQTFHLNAIDSIFISGRLLFRNFEEFIEKGFSFTALLSDPYHDMAERILLFKRQSRTPFTCFSERDLMIIEPAVNHFADVDVESPKAVRRALRQANELVRRNLVSPLTRQIVTTYAEQPIGRPSIAAAMDTLSRFAVVGIQERPEIFIRSFAEFTDILPQELPEPNRPREVDELVRHLRALPEVELLLECDLILYHFVRESLLRHADVSMHR